MTCFALLISFFLFVQLFRSLPPTSVNVHVHVFPARLPIHDILRCVDTFLYIAHSSVYYKLPFTPIPFPFYSLTSFSSCIFCHHAFVPACPSMITQVGLHQIVRVKVGEESMWLSIQILSLVYPNVPRVSFPSI